MTKALLTNREWWYPDSEFADPPHWEEKLFGNGHPFCRWYHNKIRYGVGEWGPIGWARVFWHRGKKAARKRVYRDGKPVAEKQGLWAVPRCATCRRVLWPWLVGYGLLYSGGTNCSRCEFHGPGEEMADA